jgi:hypothetical protein
MTFWPGMCASRTRTSGFTTRTASSSPDASEISPTTSRSASFPRSEAIAARTT